ncbi:MAG: A/G-specific adenine glycosylase [Bacteroidota bacterium]
MKLGEKVIDWYKEQGRKMAWRDTYDPYKIWIAEIILQQTRIAQGEAYFYRFIERFPNAKALAEAEQDEVLKYWEGLGYYSRARNLHAASHQLQENFGGKFPEDHQTLLSLKGIGPYTSRAIASFAFGEKVAVLDGNVLRVLSRVLGDFSPIDQQKARKNYQKIIDSWVKDIDSRAFNHGMMDIGSVICTPTKPGCLICPVQDDCKAYNEGITHLLPVKAGKIKRKIRHFNFLLIYNEAGELLVRQRPENVFWGGLWEIPNEEIQAEVWREKKRNEDVYLGELKHVFTHFTMMIHVFKVSAKNMEEVAVGQFIPIEKIPIFAFSRAVLNIFDRYI